MKTTISKCFDFDAAHRLPKLSATHKCHRLHGHTYRVEVIVEGEPDGGGMVIDYAELADTWDARIGRTLDHQLLNDVAGLEDPTTEIVAAWIFERLQPRLGALGVKLARIRVYESSTTWAEVAG